MSSLARKGEGWYTSATFPGDVQQLSSEPLDSLNISPVSKIQYVAWTEKMAEVNEVLSDIKADLASIKAEIPHLATKEELQSVRTEIQSVKGDLVSKIESVRNDLATIPNDIKWIKRIAAFGIPILLAILGFLYNQNNSILIKIGSIESTLSSISKSLPLSPQNPPHSSK